MPKKKRQPAVRVDKLTVGGLKKLIADAGLPDDALIFPDWASDPPGKYQPGVELVGFAIGDNKGQPYLSALVDLVSLED
jgi:hypothetical protein